MTSRSVLPDWAITTVIDTWRGWPTVGSDFPPRVPGGRVRAGEDLSAEHHEALWGWHILLSGVQHGLSGVQHGEPRQSARDGSVRGTPDMTRESAATESVVHGSPDRDAPLAIDAQTFRTLGHRLFDQFAALLDSLPHRPRRCGYAPGLHAESAAHPERAVRARRPSLQQRCDVD
jgi:hypothetical protein